IRTLGLRCRVSENFTMPTEEANPNIAPYSAIFSEHLHDIQAHLQKATPHTTHAGLQIIGSVLWSSKEIDTFFRALTIHSRFRPDLISACIKTKNVLDVVEYLELLEEGAEHVGENGDKAPIAYEMSRSWISWEETQAELLRTRENNSEARTGQLQH